MAKSQNAREKRPLHVKVVIQMVNRQMASFGDLISGLERVSVLFLLRNCN